MFTAVCPIPLSPLNTHFSTQSSYTNNGSKLYSSSCVSQLFHRRSHHFKRLSTFLSRCSSASQGASAEENFHQETQQLGKQESKGFWGKWKEHSAEMSAKLAKLGLAAVLAYGLFDGVTYTSFFVLAFLGYEKSTGKNPAANLQALLGIVILMWTGNNVTRPFRVAGAAALAPVIDKDGESEEIKKESSQ